MAQTNFSLVTCRENNTNWVGLVVDRQVWEVTRALEIIDRPRPSINGMTAPADTMLALLNAWDQWLPCLREAAGILVGNSEQDSIPLTQCALLAPVPAPGKMMNVGLNFYDHAEEMGMAVPEDFKPNFFWKGDRNCVIGPSQKIRLSSRYVDWEAELAVVIGRSARDVDPEEALDFVAGFTCHNDVTDRRLMMRADGSIDLLAGKARDTFGPLGPAIVPVEQIQNLDNLPIRCLVNGEMMQDSGVHNMIWSPAKCISALSRIFTLQPGDVIGLGTGGGVGWTHGMTLGPGDLPKARERMLRGGGIFLKAGDTVTVEIPGIGRLDNQVAS